MFIQNLLYIQISASVFHKNNFREIITLEMK